MNDSSYSLKILIESWTSHNLPKKTYYETVLSAWQKISPSCKAILGELIIEIPEIIIEVEDHLLMCDLQFQSVELLRKLNDQLGYPQENAINKLRFRLKTK
jgi:hypothetical protein